MNKLFTTLFALAVASGTAFAQAPAASAAAPAAPAAPAAAPAAKPAATPASPKSVEAKVAMCIGCHGIVGYQASFPEIHKVPMISGQNGKYIAAALNAYKKGERKHPTMRGIAESLSDQDIADISAYYEQHGKDGKTLAKEPSRQPNAQVKALLDKAACASCHGANFSTPTDPAYPKLGGQHADYLFVALKAYKDGDARATHGRSNPIMGAFAKQYSTAELKAIAGYLSSLDGELKTKPESKFR